MSTYRPRKRRSKFFWKDVTVAAVTLILILLAMADTITAQDIPKSATVTDCKVTKAANVIHVKCGNTIRTMPKAQWPKAWQYADGEHPENLPPRTRPQPTVGQIVKAIWIENEFVPVEPCAVRVNLRVRAWAKIRPGTLVPFTLREPPPDCQKPPRPLDFYQVQEILKRRQEEQQ